MEVGAEIGRRGQVGADDAPAFGQQTFGGGQADAGGGACHDECARRARSVFTIGCSSRIPLRGNQSPNWSSMMPSQICATSIATFSLMNACWVPV